jgi:hypothetical protein
MGTLLVLWLLGTVDKGMWTHCVYLARPPTVMEPEPPVHQILAVPRGTADQRCPQRVIVTDSLPEDVA